MASAAAGATALGFWEDGDQLNLVACFMGARDIAAVACTCRYTRDNLRDSTQLRWLAELRGLDPASTHISSVEHIELAEAMASLETSIGFARGDVEVMDSAMPSIERVVAMLRRHTALTLAIEAHCGLEAHPDFARQFARRRALSVRRCMEQIAEDQGAPDALSGRLITRSWGNSRPLIWAPGSQDRGRQNARVEVYLSHGEHFELPRRRPLSEYARPPDAPDLEPAASPEAAAEAERLALAEATFDGDAPSRRRAAAPGNNPESEIESEIDRMLGGQRQMVIVELPGGDRVMLPMAVLQELQQMEQGEAMERLREMMRMQQAQQQQQRGAHDDDDDEDDEEGGAGGAAGPLPEPEPGPE